MPVLTRAARHADERPHQAERLPEARLEEAVGLTRAIDLDPVHTALIALSDPRPATLIGSGKVDELAAVVADTKAELVIVDHPLTPVQQRNLEKAL
ncbi:MAG: GTPase HflX, partial [Rhizobiaceae bacterium]|nr:GTPase HflX [Rhizobiaceae bacterium]